MRRLTALLAITAWLAAGTAAPAAPPGASDIPLQGNVVSASGNSVYIDIGSDSGLTGSDLGTIIRGGLKIAVLRVTSLGAANTYLLVVEKRSGAVIQAGDTVSFETRRVHKKIKPAAPAAAPKGPKGAPRVKLPPFDKIVPSTAPAGGELPPLLAPVVKPALSNLRSGPSHGRARAWQLYQRIKPSGDYFTVSRLDAEGSTEHISGGPWSLTWAGRGTYRDGSRSSTALDFHRADPQLYRFSLSRKTEAGGVIRLGRFFPYELSGLGYVDGAQDEFQAAGGLRAGVIAGARPDWRDNGFAKRELLVSGYGTYDTGTPGSAYYSGTLGLMHTRFRGRSDQLALLHDQRLDLGPLFNLFSTAQLNFDAGAAKVRKRPDLTRLDLSANSQPAPFVSFRAGIDQYRTADTAAQREILGLSDLSYLHNNYWRYWTGSSQFVPGKLQFDEEISFTETTGNDTRGNSSPGLWRVGVTRTDLPFVPGAVAGISAYNLDAVPGSDYGTAFTCYLPFSEGRLLIYANAGARYGRRTADAAKRLSFSDASVNLTARLSKSWDCEAGFSRAWQEDIRSTIGTAGLSYRW